MRVLRSARGAGARFAGTSSELARGCCATAGDLALAVAATCTARHGSSTSRRWTILGACASSTSSIGSPQAAGSCPRCTDPETDSAPRSLFADLASASPLGGTSFSCSSPRAVEAQMRGVQFGGIHCAERIYHRLQELACSAHPT